MAETTGADAVGAVADYYNRNTRAFLRHGRQATGAIHRELWAPGVESRSQALTYVNQLLAQRLPNDGPLLDLGCGVGGTAVWLALRGLGPVLGITNSEVQLGVGEQRIAAAGLAETVEIRLGSYLRLNQAHVKPRSHSGAYAIESFIHSPDADLFFTSAAEALRPGGTLVLCDDFLSEEPSGGHARRVMCRVRAGWLATSLITPETAVELAEEAGLELRERLDLTLLHRFHSTFRRAVMHAITAIPIPHPFWHSLRGGLALQIALKRRWLRHLMLTFVKRPS